MIKTGNPLNARPILRLPIKVAIPPSSTHRRMFIDWLIAELAHDEITLPPYWTYGHLTDAVQRWRHKLQERPTDPCAGR